MSDTPLFDLTEGLKRKEEGMAQAALNATNWHHRATLVLSALPIGARFDSDGLRETMGDDNPPSNNSWGACLGGFHRVGKAEVVDFKLSQRPEAHARRILVYRRIEKNTSP